jgi:hypothetical protein
MPGTPTSPRATPPRPANVVDWVPPHGPWDDQLAFIFDGGTLSADRSNGLPPADQGSHDRCCRPPGYYSFSALDSMNHPVCLTRSTLTERAANDAVLIRADRLVAVWNGQPPGPKGGGTADVVLLAQDRGIPVDVVWTEGAQRKA